jgi:hypothetical protein
MEASQGIGGLDGVKSTMQQKTRIILSRALKIPTEGFISPAALSWPSADQEIFRSESTQGPYSASLLVIERMWWQ